MADNVSITAGSGTSIATDDIGGVHYQKIKLYTGAEGAVDGPLDAGQTTKANSLPVTLASDQDALPVTDNSGSLTVDDGGSSLTVDGSVSLAAALPAGTNAIGKLAANSGVDIGDVDVTSISAGENHLGEVGGSTAIIEVALSLDTNAYADGDVLADTQECASAVRVSAGTAVLQSVTINDKDDVGQALTLFFLRSNVSIGTENAAVSVSDANADEILGSVYVATSDYRDLGGCRLVSLKNIGLVLKPTTGTSIWVAAMIHGAGTYTASGIVVKLGILRD